MLWHDLPGNWDVNVCGWFRFAYGNLPGDQKPLLFGQGGNSHCLLVFYDCKLVTPVSGVLWCLVTASFSLSLRSILLARCTSAGSNMFTMLRHLVIYLCCSHFWPYVATRHRKRNRSSAQCETDRHGSFHYSQYRASWETTRLVTCFLEPCSLRLLPVAWWLWTRAIW